MTESRPSKAQEQFLKNEKRHHLLVGSARFLVFFLFAGLWEFSADLGVIDSFIFSSPSRIALCFYTMAMDKSIFLHIGITLYETLISFFLTVLISVTLAVLLWANRTASQIAEPYLVMLNSLPKSALAPLLIVWLGSHMHTIILAAVSVAVFGSILTLYTGFTQTDPDLIRLIRSLGGSKKDVLAKVLLPSSIPLLISTMKVNIGLCLVGVIIGEFLCANAGLGYLIIYASQVFKMDLLVMSIVILCLLSTCLYQGIAWIEKRLPF